MNREKLSISVLVLSAVLIAVCTDTLAFDQWASADPWGIADSGFTTETDTVVFNVHSGVDPNPAFPLRWYDPDGNEVDDAGTGHIWVNHFEDGFKVGHFGSMQVKGWNRAEGLWSVVGDGRGINFLIERTSDFTVSPSSLWDLEIVDSFASPGPAPIGLASDGSNVWIVADKIYRLEPSGIVDLEGELPYPGAAALDFDGTNFWNLDKSENKIYKWEISEGLAKNIIDSIPSPAFIPADLAYDGSYLWATSAITDIIYKLDATGSIEQSFDSPGSLPTGLAYDGIYLWNADADSDKIYKMDLSEDIFDSPYSHPTDMASDGTYLWVADDSSRRIYKVSSSGTVESSFVAPDSGSGGVGGLTCDGTHLWHSNHKTDKIYKLDMSGNVISSFDSPNTGPIGLAFDGTYLWCSDMLNRLIYALDTSGTVITSFSTPGYDPRGLAFDGVYLWHADNGSKRIYKLTVAGTVIDSFPSPGTPGVNQPNGLAFDGVKLWHSDNGTDKLYELIIKAPVIASFDSPGTYPYGLASDGTYLWHADMDEKMIYKMDDSGTVVANFSSPGSDPAGLTYAGGYLWNVDINTALIYKLDDTGTVVGSLTSPGTNPTGLAHDGIYWWNADAVDGEIYKLDIFNALIVAPYDPPFDTLRSNPTGLTSDGLHLWNTNPVGYGEAGKIFKMSNTGAEIDMFTIPGIYEPGALSYDGVFLWFTDAVKEKIFKMDPALNPLLNPDAIVDIIELPGFMPSDMAFSDDHLWAADESNDMIYRMKRPGHIAIGASETRTFTITSTGPVDLVIATIGVYGPDASEFSLENDNCSGQTLARDQTCTLQVVFSPDSAGDKAARFEIPSNSLIKPTMVIALSGTEVALCQCDLEPAEGDGDVDGADLAAYIADDRDVSVAALAGEFGRIDCP